MHLIGSWAGGEGCWWGGGCQWLRGSSGWPLQPLLPHLPLLPASLCSVLHVNGTSDGAAWPELSRQSPPSHQEHPWLLPSVPYSGVQPSAPQTQVCINQTPHPPPSSTFVLITFLFYCFPQTSVTSLPPVFFLSVLHFLSPPP